MRVFLLAAAGMFGMATPVQAAEYDLTWTGTVTSTNACSPGAVNCYAAVGATVSGTIRYTTGPAGLVTSTQSFYADLMSGYTLSLPGIGYTTSDTTGLFGRFNTYRDAPTQGAATASSFSAYVARDAGNYTFLSPTGTVDFAPRIPTSAGVPGDDFYGDLMVSEVRVNFIADSALFADLLVPTTFDMDDLSPTSNFGVGLYSDLVFANRAGYSFGGGITSVTVTPVTAGPGPAPTPTPEPMSFAVLAMGLAGLLAARRRS
jgi:MYXO-CTERM domain-containing protein